ncbi:unnamed protein product [Phytomonas sp. Hart1]|nr:unnamed protein product [Phytomonas sp. Hart1]|eukprot:CCW70779.1 unnamed protein product [Phytomonas sp. isolate Hart1]
MDSSHMCVGALVLAPYRLQINPHPSSPLPNRMHRTAYALAEITGIQASSGTASISFLLLDPGADDDAVSLFDLLPCPPQYLRRLALFKSSKKHNSRPGPDGGTIQNGDTADEENGDDAVADGCESPQSPIEYLLQDSVHAGLVHPDRAYATWLRQFELFDDSSNTTASSRSAGAQEGRAEKRTRALSSIEEGIHKPHFLLQRKKCENVVRPTVTSPSLLDSRSDHPAATSIDPVDGILTATHIPPMSKHTFFANTFREVNTIVENQLLTASRLEMETNSKAKLFHGEHSCGEIGYVGVPVVLCVFDHYEILRRFEVFMSLRGHIVWPIDGVSERDSELLLDAVPGRNHSSVPICQGKTPIPAITSAFSTVCKVWLCMLREDSYGGEWNLLRLLFDAPPIDFLLFVHDTETPPQPLYPADPIVKAESIIPKLLTHLKEPSRRLVVRFRDAPQTEEEMTTGSKVRVSGSVFKDNKVLVPASREQLLLMQTVLSTPIADPVSSPFSTDAHRLGPALLERIALGSFTDSAASHLFAAFAGAAAVRQRPTDHKHAPAPTAFTSIPELQRKFCQNPLAFGEAFPIFAVARAIVRDVCSRQAGGLGRLPRLALVLHRGNPAGAPLRTTDVFLANLRQYFAPWCVHEVGPAAPPQPHPSHVTAVPTSVLWDQQGGLMMLFSDERNAGLHDEADVVIACGKTAAAWVAANARPSLCCFAVLSEVEVAPVHDTTYTWFPFDPASIRTDLAAQSSIAKREIVWRQLLEHATKSTLSSISAKSILNLKGGSKHSIQIPKVLQQALILYQHLTADTAKQSGDHEEEDRIPNGPTVWPNLSAFIKTIVLNCVTTMPVQMVELTIKATDDE